MIPNTSRSLPAMTIPRRQFGAAAAALLGMAFANGSQAAEPAIDPAYRAQPRPIHYETPLSPRDGPPAAIVPGRNAPYTLKAVTSST